MTGIFETVNQWSVSGFYIYKTGIFDGLSVCQVETRAEWSFISNWYADFRSVCQHSKGLAPLGALKLEGWDSISALLSRACVNEIIRFIQLPFPTPRSPGILRVHNLPSVPQFDGSGDGRDEHWQSMPEKGF